MPQYTQQQFREDLNFIKESARDDNAMRLGVAIKRANSLLAAGGSVGSIVQGGNRHQLQTALQQCEAELAGLMTPPESQGDASDAGGVEA